MAPTGAVLIVTRGVVAWGIVAWGIVTRAIVTRVIVTRVIVTRIIMTRVMAKATTVAHLVDLVTVGLGGRFSQGEAILRNKDKILVRSSDLNEERIPWGKCGLYR